MEGDRRLRIYSDDACLKHRIPDGALEYPSDERLAVTEPHPERPERLENIRSILTETVDDHIDWVDVEPATTEQLKRVHTEGYVSEIEEACSSGEQYLTQTTVAMNETWPAALAAAGASISVGNEAASASQKVPYALVRPPGHHAQPSQADGFCFFNNSALAADAALRAGDERVAIVDWDVHPGNGTQECFYDRDDVLVVSLHNDFGKWGPSHPQTNSTEEVGKGLGEGFSVNIPLPPGTGDEGYAFAFEQLVEPILTEFDPGTIIVTAGQDPGIRDPTGRNLVTKAGFQDMGRRIKQVGEQTGAGIGVIQAGGYQLSHLPYATLGVFEGLIGTSTGVEDPYPLLEEYTPPARKWVREASEVHGRFWPV